MFVEKLNYNTMGSQIVIHKTSYDRLKNKMSKLTYSCDHLTIVHKDYLSQLDQDYF